SAKPRTPRRHCPIPSSSSSAGRVSDDSFIPRIPAARKPFRRVTFSVVSQPQDPHQQGSLQSCYDSGLDESETPSSKSSSGPRLGALPLPEDSYERTTPDGSVGEAEHMENGYRTRSRRQSSPPLVCAVHRGGRLFKPVKGRNRPHKK
uniref:Uncharacterized protein n=1 Tax=Cyclopterus lumpus TaxID=8103 RepID=A0A8C3AG07_CYCLU